MRDVKQFVEENPEWRDVPPFYVRKTFAFQVWDLHRQVQTLGEELVRPLREYFVAEWKRARWWRRFIP